MNLFFDFCEACLDFFGVLFGTIILLVLLPTVVIVVLALLPIFAIIGFFVALFRALFGRRESQENLR